MENDIDMYDVTLAVVWLSGMKLELFRDSGKEHLISIEHLLPYYFKCIHLNVSIYEMLFLYQIHLRESELFFRNEKLVTQSFVLYRTFVRSF